MATETKKEVKKIKNVIGDRVFLKDLIPLRKPELKSGIVELEYYQMMKEATVAFVGELVTDMKPGDKVVFLMPAGYDFEFEGQKFQNVRRTDIWFVM